MKGNTQVSAGCKLDNRAHLQVSINELAGVESLIDQLIETSVSHGSHAERIAGLQDVRAMVTRRAHLAERRMAQLSALRRRGEPVVLDPEGRAAVQSLQGQPLSPIVSRPAVDTEGISSAEIWMPPGHAAHAHVHHETDIIVLVRDGEAVTMWWDDRGDVHEVRQRAGQHLHIPRAVPHAALNLGTRPVIASEFRSSPVFDEDNHRLHDLEPVVRTRLEAARSAA